jgi:hypothetical protein
MLPTTRSRDVRAEPADWYRLIRDQQGIAGRDADQAQWICGRTPRLGVGRHVER